MSTLLFVCAHVVCISVCMCVWVSVCVRVGLVRTVYLHRIWPYAWWFSCWKYRMCTEFTYKCMVMANPMYVCESMCVCLDHISIPFQHQRPNIWLALLVAEAICYLEHYSISTTASAPQPQHSSPVLYPDHFTASTPQPQHHRLNTTASAPQPQHSIPVLHPDHFTVVALQLLRWCQRSLLHHTWTSRCFSLKPWLTASIAAVSASCGHASVESACFCLRISWLPQSQLWVLHASMRVLKARVSHIDRQDDSIARQL